MLVRVGETGLEDIVTVVVVIVELLRPLTLLEDNLKVQAAPHV